MEGMGLGSSVFESAENLDLQERDIYSQDSLGTIQCERFECKLGFYVCVVEEEKKLFTFEGSRFIEAFVRKCQRGEILLHPTTRAPIRSFKVFKYTSQNPSPILFQVLDVELMKSRMRFLPILCDDHTRTNQERGKFYFMMAECYRIGEGCDKDPHLQISHCRMAAVLGFEDAKYNLSHYLKEQGNTKESLYWILQYWKNKDITAKGCLQVAFALEDCHLFNAALMFYERAACLGNPYSIGKVIDYYEQGIGVPKNSPLIELWRTLLPQDWQNRNIAVYLEHLSTDSSSGSATKKLDLPSEITERQASWSNADPDKLLPNVKKEIEKQTDGLYIQPKSA